MKKKTKKTSKQTNKKANKQTNKHSNNLTTRYTGASGLLHLDGLCCSQRSHLRTFQETGSEEGVHQVLPPFDWSTEREHV